MSILHGETMENNVYSILYGEPSDFFNEIGELSRYR